ncbi:YidC/Oxa1 family membrane protein insertase [Rhodobium orientis]|uniref:Membrane protein insertase YidC n=1 Tax=Rhodobium orientis TaxID=34017 RepID=A0A327JPU9_9HYPH|nr:membrane protein insertase YidC [Rhodobium orientis]MBB4304683.1 YidC/Oxa1 family membrane protein insertase [Rhodobium orientis]MBK5950058.1 membrane protein insertase YidC [Rhodobium orientis]RAI27745.1 membrane protein insertase YidC [Rhodobium orientis]
MSENRNLILAIVLSLVVLVAWQYFYAGPKIEKEQQRQAAQQEQTAAAPGTAVPGSVPSSDSATPTAPSGAPTQTPGQAAPTPGGTTTPAAPAESRAAALSGSARVPVDTPSISGSINLKGGRIDDIVLKQYRETVEPDSPNIVLFSPSGAPDAYYAEMGWVADRAANLSLPSADTVWSVASGTTLTPSSPVVLSWDNGAGLTFKRTYEVDKDYLFTVSDTVENTGDAAAVLFPYALISRHGKPHTTNFYILHEGLLGVFGDEGLQEVDYDDLTEDARHVTPPKVSRGWLGITDKYWAATLIPRQGTQFQPKFSSRTAGAKNIFQADYLADPVTVAAGGSATTEQRLFAGAKQVSVIDRYGDAYDIEGFDLLIDWGWFYFITKPLFYIIDYLFRLVGNFGIAILVVTVMVKLVFFPLANKSYVSMSRMKKIQPQVQALKERFPDDKVKQQQAQMELFQKEKINPLSGCLPIVIQIPVFFALYKVLFVTIEMRHAPFFGWIQDLASPDPTSVFNLFGLIPWDPPHMLMIGVWPLIMGVTMFLQMKLNPAPPDPTQQMIFTWMPVLFTFMLASFPAGLVIYWAWNNSLSILQQYVIMRRQGVKVELFKNVTDTFKKKKPKEGGS